MSAPSRLLARFLMVTCLGLVLSHAPGLAHTGRIALMLKTNVPLTPDVVDAIAGHSVQVTYVWPEIRVMAIVASPTQVPTLEADSRVAWVEQDMEAGVMGNPPSEAPALVSITIPQSTSTTPITTWNQDMANTSGSAETGEGVTVAVLDSGLPQNWQEFLPADCVDLEHAAGFGAAGWGDFHSEVNAIRGVGGHIGLFPHGLAVSSVIVGFPSEAGPIEGAAPGVRILPIRVINQFNFAWFSWFTAGVMHVANLKASGAIPGPIVINFSIQAHSNSLALTDAINYAISQGVLFVTIAGNFTPDDIVSFPGRLPQCITAGAVGWRSEGLPPQPWFFGDVPENASSEAYVANFSGREPLSVPSGSMIDVMAPGSFVFGEWVFGPGYSEEREVAFEATDNFIFGTSFAAPHVAGIVARMLERNPGLTQAEAEFYLRSTALPIADSPAPFSTPLGSYILPWDARATGAGLVQGAEAVAATPPLANIAARFPGDASAGAATVRVISRAGSLPIELGLHGFPEGATSCRLFTVQGRLVREWNGTSARSVTWDGTMADGSTARSGIYFVQAQGKGVRSTAKVMVVR